ncbi:MAG: molybdenum cofactor guanylyltransferase MobA [Sneathiella sp.]|nr:molybdenum cofactor guanylyltransferase MobA [Sneathiella sp.]
MITPKFPCIILAGGQSRRMGDGDKFLKKIAGQTLLDHILQRIEPQVSEVLINSNAALENVSWPVVSDAVDEGQGPLAGIMTGLEYFKEKGCTASHMLSIPADAPFIPNDLVKRLEEGITSSPHSIVMAYSKDRVHPVVSLWPFSLTVQIRAALVGEDLRKILIFAERYSLSGVRWTDSEGDPFFNVNTPEDLEVARIRMEMDPD